MTQSTSSDAPAQEADHPATNKCGFDRNASHSAGVYVCECGWQEERETLGRQVAELTLNHVESERQLRVWQDQVAELQDKLKLAEQWRTGYEQAKADRIEAQKLGMQAMDENAALREWESRCAVALGVPGCHPEEVLNVIDGMREDAERYRHYATEFDGKRGIGAESCESDFVTDQETDAAIISKAKYGGVKT